MAEPVEAASRARRRAMGLVEALSGCTELREYERPTRAPVPVEVHDEEVAFILDGHVTVTVEDAPHAILGVFGPGDVLGALAGRGPSHDRVHALGSVMLAVMPASGLAGLLQSRDVAGRVLEALDVRHRTLQQRAADTTKRADQRLARQLLWLSRRFGRKTQSGSLRLPFPLTQTELGGLVDLTRETVNKHFTTWVAEGLVEGAPGHIIVVHRPEVLMELV